MFDWCESFAVMTPCGPRSLITSVLVTVLVRILLTSFSIVSTSVTPAHDFNDYAVGQRHNLPIMSILTLDADRKSVV